MATRDCTSGGAKGTCAFGCGKRLEPSLLQNATMLFCAARVRYASVIKLKNALGGGCARSILLRQNFIAWSRARRWIDVASSRRLARNELRRGLQKYSRTFRLI